jgi:hypothetical protein
VNGKTYIKFVKSLKTADPSFADACISDDQTYKLIYAFGQVAPNLSHTPQSSLEIIPEGARSSTAFYKPDELKYHGGGIGTSYPGRGALGSGSTKLTGVQNGSAGACTPSNMQGFDCMMALQTGEMKVHYKKVAAGGEAPCLPLHWPSWATQIACRCLYCCWLWSYCSEL